jgi:MraZ protein
MFLGKYEHSLDDKNRVVLPAALRKDLSDQELQDVGLVLATGTDNEFLELHTKEEWSLHSKMLDDKYPVGKLEVEQALHGIHSNVYEIQLDRQYRFLIPEEIKKLVGIQRDVSFIGVTKKIVIYARERWNAYQEKLALAQKKKKSESAEGAQGAA